MKYSHAVKIDGVLYPAGADVPDRNVGNIPQEKSHSESGDSGKQKRSRKSKEA